MGMVPPKVTYMGDWEEPGADRRCKGYCQTDTLLADQKQQGAQSAGAGAVEPLTRGPRAEGGH